MQKRADFKLITEAIVWRIIIFLIIIVLVYFAIKIGGMLKL